jgi:DNA-binding CsgD family transcriptional regulator
MAWFGFFRPQPFGTQEKTLLRLLVPPLRYRLRLEMEVRRTRLLAAGFEAALEALGRPAYILDHRGRVVHANPLGLQSKHSLASLRTAAREIKGSARRQSFALRIPGVADHELVVIEPTGPEHGIRRAAFAQRFSLTPKQLEVLTHVVEGLTNKEIAAELGCAESTIELHVSGLFRKIAVDNRGALIAAYWRA